MAKRDVTIETVEALFDKKIPAFQSMMTYFAYRRACGVQAMAYRTTAGIIHQCQVYCLPGLPSLIKIGWKRSFCRKSFICIRKSRSKWIRLKSYLSPAGRGAVRAPCRCPSRAACLCRDGPH